MGQFYASGRYHIWECLKAGTSGLSRMSWAQSRMAPIESNCARVCVNVIRQRVKRGHRYNRRSERHHVVFELRCATQPLGSRTCLVSCRDWSSLGA